MPATTTRIEVEAVATLAELERHAVAWNELASRSPQQLPMCSYAWTATYLEWMLPSGSQWTCFFAYRDSRLLAVLPVVTRNVTRAGLRMLALGTPRDDHTQIGDLLCASEEDFAAIPLLLDAVAQRYPAAAYLEINRFPDTSKLLNAINGGFMKRACSVRQDSYGAFLPVPSDFAAYRNGLSKNFKSNLNKAINKVAKLKEVAYRFDDGRAERPEDFAAFVACESSGWKGAAGSAIAKSPQLLGFYATLVKRLTAAGWLEWQMMTGDGTTLAANLAIRLPRSVIVWKLGYNDAYSRCSPGSILMEELVKREAAAKQLDEINLTTDLPWYDNWEMKRRLYHTARIYFGARGRLLWYFPDALRSRLARIPALRALKAALQRRGKPAAGADGAHP